MTLIYSNEISSTHFRIETPSESAAVPAMRIASLPWQRIETDLNQQGSAVLEGGLIA
jgi:hypothetical protein